MPYHDTKDNAGFYRFIPDSRTITIIVVSFLFYISYFTGITILVMFQPRRHSSKKKKKAKVKIFINIKERLPRLFSDFSKYKTIVLRRRPRVLLDILSFLTVNQQNQETKTSKSPGWATQTIFSVARGQASLAPLELEHSLESLSSSTLKAYFSLLC